MVTGVETEADCSYHGCQRVAYVEFEFGSDSDDSRWFCFPHAIQTFESWDDHEMLDIVTFPDVSFFDCAGYPAKLATLVAAHEHGES